MIVSIKTAEQIAARIWADPEYSHVQMNPATAHSIAVILAGEANYQNIAKEKEARMTKTRVLLKHIADETDKMES